jgi:hypothetical protein
MHLVTKESLIATAAERYREAYQRRTEWLPAPDGKDAEAIYQQLKALPATTGEAEILALTGDSRWTANICDECGEDRERVVLVAIEIHHPTDMAAICPSCLQQALQLVKA